MTRVLPPHDPSSHENPDGPLFIGDVPWRHFFWHWLALRRGRACPGCHRPLRPYDSWRYFAGEVWHPDCMNM